MLKLNISPEKILPLLKNTLLPALFFGAAVIGFYATNPLAEMVCSLCTAYSMFYVLLPFSSFCISTLGNRFFSS